MNFLAHARLSFGDPGVLVGNMISDFVKGRKKELFPDKIRQGIYLHRCIDEYTDAHPATREARELFRPSYRLYCGAMMDVVYDHFLASDEAEFSDATLKQFAAEVYGTLREFESWLPAPFARMLPFMESQNWLYNYRQLSGVRSSFGGLVRRAAFLTDSEPAARILDENYEPLRNFYHQFWSDMKSFAWEQYKGHKPEGEN